MFCKVVHCCSKKFSVCALNLLSKFDVDVRMSFPVLAYLDASGAGRAATPSPVTAQPSPELAESPEAASGEGTPDLPSPMPATPPSARRIVGNVGLETEVDPDGHLGAISPDYPPRTPSVPERLLDAVFEPLHRFSRFIRYRQALHRRAVPARGQLRHGPISPSSRRGVTWADQRADDSSAQLCQYQIITPRPDSPESCELPFLSIFHVSPVDPYTFGCAVWYLDKSCLLYPSTWKIELLQLRNTTSCYQLLLDKNVGILKPAVTDNGNSMSPQQSAILFLDQGQIKPSWCQSGVCLQEMSLEFYKIVTNRAVNVLQNETISFADQDDYPEETPEDEEFEEDPELDSDDFSEIEDDEEEEMHIFLRRPQRWSQYFRLLAGGLPTSGAYLSYR